MISNLPDISKAFSEEKTQEQILDSLQKYRKELNFLLMNLDEANMPAIAGRLDGMDGSFSLIDQQLDSITLAVGNNDGDISALSLRADSIQAQVSNNDGDIASLVITAQGLQTQVSNNDGDISTITQTVNGIQTTVSSHDTLLGTHTTQITQLDNEISSVVSFTDVSGNEVASKINQTATTIKLQANKIDLTGITTIYSPTSVNDKLVISSSYAYFYLAGNNYLRLAKGLLGALITSPSEGKIYFGDDVAIGGDLNVLYDLTCGSLKVNGDFAVTSNAAVNINATTYGIDIRRSGYASITIPWGWSP